MAKLSAREAWAKATGKPKELYSSSSEGQADKAYSSAKDTYLQGISDMKSRYEDLYNTLNQQETSAQAQNEALSGTEKTQQKDLLARRGIEVNTSNPMFNTEANKLMAAQNVRSEATAANFAGQRINASMAEGNYISTANAAIANLAVDKVKTIADITYKNNYLDFMKDKDAKDRALEYYKLAKSEASASGGSKDYNNTISQLVASAYSGSLGTQGGIRESIINTLSAKFPNMASQGKIADDVYKFLPDNWENSISNVKTTSQPASAIKQIMDEYGVDESTATKMWQSANAAG